MAKILRFGHPALFITSLLMTLLAVSSFTTKVADDATEFYVFADKWVNGVPTGFMGERDGKSIKLNDKYTTNPYKGETCIQFAVDNSEKWRGIHIQFTGSWNVALDESTPLANLSGYDQLEFYARAEEYHNQPYIIPEIGIGGGGPGEDKVDDTFLEIGPEWEKHTINLKGADLKRINTLLYMTLPPGTLYLDEIKFTKKKKK